MWFCWSFSATEVMEGAWSIAKGELLSLSNNNWLIVQIIWIMGVMWINGWSLPLCDDNGMCLESEYPYNAKGGE